MVKGPKDINTGEEGKETTGTTSKGDLSRTSGISSEKVPTEHGQPEQPKASIPRVRKRSISSEADIDREWERERRKAREMARDKDMAKIRVVAPKRIKVGEETGKYSTRPQESIRERSHAAWEERTAPPNRWTK
jgi:hypothetical protein